MMTRHRHGRIPHLFLLSAGMVLSLTHCQARITPMSQSELEALATRYAAAWSSRNPDSLASFYTAAGSLVVNGGTPAVGRGAIRDKAGGFMAAFPDMQVRMDSVAGGDGHAVFYWTWTGTNTGPGGTGRAVDLTGYEEWTMAPDGLIAESLGHYDEAEYERQVNGTP